jgi:hypothetical protein
MTIAGHYSEPAGMTATRLTYHYMGRDFRLTDVKATW